MPLEMSSEAKRAKVAILQENHQDYAKFPLYQVRAEKAAKHDPEIVTGLKYNPMVQTRADPKLASSNLVFFNPWHFLYHRNQGIPGSSYND